MKAVVSTGKFMVGKILTWFDGIHMCKLIFHKFRNMR